MKKFLLLLTTLFAVSCNLDFLDDDTEGYFAFEDYNWSVTGRYAPAGYQEIVRMVYDYAPEDERSGLVPAEFTFDAGTLRIIFPSGAYRLVGYTVDEATKTIYFDDAFIFGDYGYPAVHSCNYRKETILEENFITLYEAVDPDNVDLDKGEWSISMIAKQGSSIIPLRQIHCEYGTGWVGMDLGYPGGPLWGNDYVDGGLLFNFVSSCDLATVYWGPDWRLPTRSEAIDLLSWCTPSKFVVNSETGVGFVNEKTGDLLFLPAPQIDTWYGFWLSDGSALVYSLDAMNECTAAVLNPADLPAGEFCILPVRR